ncbi:FmdB family zinc ribbon protein [Rubripirellula obstinata]|nr:zinc ribbon domain-containing protein [Rubripirellula obstinata]
MPTYDYECGACEHTFEEFQGINDAVLKKCPKCKKNKLQRLFGTGAAIVFKGSGFYQTDYRSDSYKKAAKADSKKAEGDSSSKKSDSKSKSESKPAKTETKSKKKD